MKSVIIWHTNGATSYFHNCVKVKELADCISLVYCDNNLKKQIIATFLHENIAGYGVDYENSR